MKLQENGGSYIMLSYTHCILRVTLLGITTEMAGHVARIEKFRNEYRVLVGKPESKRLLGKAET